MSNDPSGRARVELARMSADLADANATVERLHEEGTLLRELVGAVERWIKAEYQGTALEQATARNATGAVMRKWYTRQKGVGA